MSKYPFILSLSTPVNVSVIGGYDGRKALNSVEFYSESSSEWQESRRTRLAQERRWAAGTQISHKLFTYCVQKRSWSPPPYPLTLNTCWNTPSMWSHRAKPSCHDTCPWPDNGRTSYSHFCSVQSPEHFSISSCFMTARRSCDRTSTCIAPRASLYVHVVSLLEVNMN